MKPIFVLLLFAVVCVSPVCADARVGTVTSIVGTVTIDAFGKGAFIPAANGDDLYASTVLKTGPNGRATLTIQGQVNEVLPGATVKISELAAARARKGGLSWFTSVGRLVRSFADASQRKENDLVLGTRAAERGGAESTDTEWEVEETDASVLIPQARKNMEPGGYASALETLANVEAPDDPEVAWQLSFWRGFCYFQVEDYADAVKYLSAARDLGTAPQLVQPAYRAVLLFQLGASLYFIGNDKEAERMLGSYLSDYADGQFAEYAKQLLALIRK